MLTKDFYFDLPQDLIAQYPVPERGSDRLMTLGRKTGEIRHCAMADLPDLLPKNALVVFNDSRVRKSRVFATSVTTGKSAEFLFLGILSPTRWKVMVRNARKHKPGMTYIFPDGVRAIIVENANFMESEFRELVFDAASIADWEDWFEQNGHIPLPPYIAREDSHLDAERYQTVYARETGSAAAPTAGLHFTQSMLRRISDVGIETVWVTLHVGLGTFLPVRADNIEDHIMHEEIYTISENTAEKINAAKKGGRPVIAVGTTSVRTLESAWQTGQNGGGIRAESSGTRIFIYPGYQFRVVDGIFTNFHTPESTLLMLVSAFAGKEHIFNAYQCAIENRYRFFSYGDAMLIM
jgi:S-adenosylmethionine:tRNA ribosyltransferase-isomerase